jgi:transposase
MKTELKAAVLATGPHLMNIHGIGPAGAARILADAGDAARFPDRNHFASWTGTAPIDASRGQHLRHRLSRAGNRRLNHVLYMAGIVQLRYDTAGRAYYRRKLAAGKTSMEAMRCLRRRLSDAVYRQLAADAAGQEEASPGGHPGASLISSAAGLSPDTGTSDQPLPGPAHPTLPPPSTTPKAMAPAAAATRRRARGVNVERPTGSDSPGESHPRASTDPCVTVSRYTALAVLVIWRPVSPRPSVRSTAALLLPRPPASWSLSSRSCASCTCS